MCQYANWLRYYTAQLIGILHIGILNHYYYRHLLTVSDLSANCAAKDFIRACNKIFLPSCIRVYTNSLFPINLLH